MTTFGLTGNPPTRFTGTYGRELEERPDRIFACCRFKCREGLELVANSKGTWWNNIRIVVVEHFGDKNACWKGYVELCDRRLYWFS